MSSQIEHSGVVERIGRDTVYVKIVVNSACGSCKARGACGLADVQDKTVEVKLSNPSQYAVGEEVMVGVRRGVGAVAVLLAYVGALVVLLAVLVGAISGFGMNEGLAALAGLVAVGLYYLILWLFRDKIEHTIHFSITKNY